MLRREGSSPSSRTSQSKENLCGNSSVVERHLAKVDVAGPTPVSRSIIKRGLKTHIICGNSSVVERHLAKVDVAGPTPVSRSKI